MCIVKRPFNVKRMPSSLFAKVMLEYFCIFCKGGYTVERLCVSMYTFGD
jgi:hypothetical protein